MKIKAKRIFSIFLVLFICFSSLQAFAVDNNYTQLYLTLYWNIEKDYIGSTWEYKSSATSEDINYINDLLEENEGIYFTLYQNGMEVSSRKIPVNLIEKDGMLCTDSFFFGSFPSFDETGKEYDYSVKATDIKSNQSPISVHIDLSKSNKESYSGMINCNFNCNIKLQEVYDNHYHNEDSEIYNITYPYRTIHLKVNWENGEPENIDFVTIPLKGDGFVVEEPSITVYKSEYWKQTESFRYKADYSIEDIQIDESKLRGYKTKIELYSCQPDSEYTPSLDKNIDLIVNMQRIGYVSIIDEYYMKDKDGNLFLEDSVSREEFEILDKTEFSKEDIDINAIHNNKEYTFFENDGNFTFEVGKENKLILKYTRDALYLPYEIKHEYYVKDKNNNVILEDSFIEEGNKIENSQLNSNDFIQLNYNKNNYEYLEDSGTIVIKENQKNNITIKYIRNEEYADYTIKHEYYVRDKNEKLILEDSITENYNDIVNSYIDGKNFLKNEHKEISYQVLENNSITLRKDKENTLIIKYIRDKEYGSYIINHNYYIKDKNGNFILEKTIKETMEFIEPNVNIGLKDADIIISQRLIEGYIFKDASDNMIIKANKQSEFNINYFREEPITLKYGSYQVIHQYYLDNKLELTITEDIVSNIKVGTSIGVTDADILIPKKLNQNNKTYEFSSANKIVIEENKTGTLIIKYIRQSEEPPVIEEVNPVLVTITANKKLENATLKNKQFSFRLANGTETYIAENDANGNIVFNPLTFNSEGTYRFTITEDDNKIDNIKYDSSKYSVEITVLKKESKLIASVKYFKDNKEVSKIDFVNKYEEPKKTESNKNETELIEIKDNEVPQSNSSSLSSGTKASITQNSKINQNKTNLTEITDESVPKTNKPVQTGDETPIIIYLSMAILSIIGMMKLNKKLKK